MHHELGKFVRGLSSDRLQRRKFTIGLQQRNRCFQIVRRIGSGETGRGEIILPERMKGLLADQSFMGSLALSVRLVIRVDELVQTVEQFVDHDRWWYRLVPPDGLSHVTQVEKFTGCSTKSREKDNGRLPGPNGLRVHDHPTSRSSGCGTDEETPHRSFRAGKRPGRIHSASVATRKK